ncbi:hypothetical protein NXC12_PD00330 (plasmid) [Rhizobium etli]|uniref:Uncharacterized protein n=1 Tax=Rhizobium etli TaxID=29449 RepID=A0AAN1EN72_RHIET|nr:MULTISPECIES: DUF269 domain-containing protein [Rhizobium]ARO32512.1 hypothetical protein NXC14_PA00238 [Rhizobium sp. NXC14]ARQ13423.1 hypothetical protein NXC12_PD00330 [Rhizobium etli]
MSLDHENNTALHRTLKGEALSPGDKSKALSECGETLRDVQRFGFKTPRKLAEAGTRRLVDAFAAISPHLAAASA